MKQHLRSSYILSLCILALVTLPSAKAHAKLFRSAYVQFELPEHWNCALEGTEWVCSSQNKNDARESIIIFTAKEVGPQDSLQAYERFLKTPKTINSTEGKPTPSLIKDVRIRKISDQPWVDSLHLGSEVPGYYTRYLATVKDKLAVLVTFSAHQKFFTKYSNDYFRAVESLRLIVDKNLFGKPLPPVANLPNVVGPNINTNFPAEPTDAPGMNDEDSQGSSTGKKRNMMIGLAVILLACGYYIFKKS